jgi:hypothetical protein
VIFAKKIVGEGFFILNNFLKKGKIDIAKEK